MWLLLVVVAAATLTSTLGVGQSTTCSNARDLVATGVAAVGCVV
jgi:hypothetical protein